MTIALFELTTYSAGDIAGFQSCYRTKTAVTNIAVRGGTNSNAGAGEAELDIEVVLGLAPEARLLVYEAANGGTGTIDELTAVADQDRAQVMSSSWGICEAFLGASAAKAENSVFEQAAAQGQSMVSIPGDEGSEGCLPNDFSPQGTVLGQHRGAERCSGRHVRSHRLRSGQRRRRGVGGERDNPSDRGHVQLRRRHPA